MEAAADMLARSCVRGLAALLLAAGAAKADVLYLLGGGQVRGTVKEVVFKTGAAPTIYPRASLVSLTVTSAPDATAVLYGERKADGEVVSVRMLTHEGVRTISGSKIKALELTKEGLVPEAKRPPKPSQDDEEDDEGTDDSVSEEQRELLEANKALYKEFYDKLEGVEDEEKEALKAEYMPKCDKVVETAKKINKTIQDKIRRREEADRRYREELRRYHNDRRNKNNYAHRRRPPSKPKHNDGLEKDQRELEYVRSAGIKLKRIIAGKTNDIERNTTRREDRLKIVYKVHKKKVLAGEKLSEKDMKAHYEAALVLDAKK
jgi:hypothetical protein